MDDTEGKIDTFGSLILGTMAFITNFLQLSVTIRKRQYLLPFDVSVLSLCMADVVTSVGVLVFSTLAFIHVYEPISEFMLINMPIVLTFAVTSSAFHVSFIAIQRLLAVSKPIKFRILFKRRHCMLMLISIWILSALLTYPWKDPSTMIAMKCIFILSASTLIPCYLFLCWHMKKNRSVPSSSNAVNQKVYIHSLAVTILFLVCKIPPIVYAFMYTTSDVFRLVSEFFFYLNASLNPIIYFYLNRCNLRRCLKCLGRNKVDCTTETRIVAAIPVRRFIGTQNLETA